MIAHAIMEPRRGAPRGLMGSLPTTGAVTTEAALATMSLGVRARPALPRLMAGPPMQCAW